MAVNEMAAQYIFFSGKGGVGKTSMACTHAVRLAEQGQKTLIVTTDPASNLSDVFEQPIGHQITPIQRLPGKSRPGLVIRSGCTVMKYFSVQEPIKDTG